MDNDIEVCELLHAHSEVVKNVAQLTPDTEKLYLTSELFKAFGDVTRLRMLYALHESELCVCDLSLVVGMSCSAISHQLKVLKNLRLVKFRREGKTVFYSLSDDHVKKLLEQAMEHVNE